MSKRFQDKQQYLEHFQGETLLRCPQCQALARSVRIVPDNHDCFTPRRLSCLHCGYSRHWAERSISRGWHVSVDDYFNLPLWLQTPCCGETLWAYNLKHLDFIEHFVRATLRERSQSATGWANASLTSRLPQWMKAAKNRQRILQSCALLRRKLEASKHPRYS